MTDIAARVEAARQCWNAGDLDGYLTLYDDSIRLHGYSPEPMDKPTATGFDRMIWAALAETGQLNPRLEFHEVLVDDNLYCCRFTMTGAQHGEFMGVPPSGKPYVLPGITIMRFEGDGVVERRYFGWR
jgi:predicted ester cyclase